MSRNWPNLIAILIVVLSGVASGLWSGRWTPSPAIEEAAAKLSRVPMDFGDWKGEADELDPEQIKIAELAGSVARRYANSKTGAQLMIMLVCGRPGPISVHTPDICYAGLGFNATAAPIRRPIWGNASNPTDTFMSGDFTKTRASLSTTLRIFWTWSADGSWQTPDTPRIAFARASALYKLYVIREVPESGASSAEDDPSLTFLHDFLPELDRALFERKSETESGDRIVSR